MVGIIKNTFNTASKTVNIGSSAMKKYYTVFDSRPSKVKGEMYDYNLVAIAPKRASYVIGQTQYEPFGPPDEFKVFDKSESNPVKKEDVKKTEATEEKEPEAKKE